VGQNFLQEGTGSPAKLVDRLCRHLRRHSLWDALLIFSPPLLLFSYLVIYTYNAPFVLPQVVIFVGATLLGTASLLGFLSLLPVSPPAQFAARLIDDKIKGKERFLTLATIDQASCPPFLFNRLCAETVELLHRVELKRDFPYQLKRSFFNSLMASLAFLLLFHLLLQLDLFSFRTAPDEALALLTQKLSQVPHFSELARRLEALAARLQAQTLSEEERRPLIQELLKMVENQLAAEKKQGGTGSDLLNQLAEQLRELDKKAGKGQEKGGGGLKTNLPEEGEGKGKESTKGGEGEGQNKSGALTSKNIQGERSAQKSPSKAEGQGNQGRGDKSKDGRREEGEREGMAKTEKEGKGGKSKGDEVPRGTPPADRFTKPGEQGEKGIKDPAFVTVELPEEETDGSTGASGPGKRREPRPKVPISNVPLKRPDSPDASPEKQPLPLEYRKLIR
jgi:hypothetical protein